MKLYLSKALKTSKITRDEAEEYFRYLSLYTDLYIKSKWTWYFNKGYYPIKAQVKNGAEKEPKFSIHHHTSNINRDYKPALHRFFQAKKASSNFIISESGNIIYLVPIQNKSYHAVKRKWFSEDFMRAFNIEQGWINEPGIEVAGNGNKKLFTYEQFLSIICVQRYLNAYFPTIKRIFSHRKFSPASRKNDPGKFFLLALIEDASFNDIDLKDESYWLQEYKKDPIKFMNNSYNIIKDYGLEDKDEWLNERKKMKVTSDNL